jgi:hypothetical protein
MDFDNFDKFIHAQFAYRISSKAAFIGFVNECNKHNIGWNDNDKVKIDDLAFDGKEVLFFISRKKNGLVWGRRSEHQNMPIVSVVPSDACIRAEKFHVGLNEKFRVISNEFGLIQTYFFIDENNNIISINGKHEHMIDWDDEDSFVIISKFRKNEYKDFYYVKNENEYDSKEWTGNFIDYSLLENDNCFNTEIEVKAMFPYIIKKFKKAVKKYD